MAAEVAQLQVADGQPNDGRLVQLAGDGSGQRQHFGQLVELVVLFAASRARCIARLLLAQLENAARSEKWGGGGIDRENDGRLAGSMHTNTHTHMFGGSDPMICGICFVFLRLASGGLRCKSARAKKKGSQRPYISPHVLLFSIRILSFVELISVSGAVDYTIRLTLKRRPFAISELRVLACC